MKKFLTIIAILFATLCGKAQTVQGWPSGYGGVMFQAFYWDSYSDTQWTNLTSQADTLAKYFDLVWVLPRVVIAILCRTTWAIMIFGGSIRRALSVLLIS